MYTLLLAQVLTVKKVLYETGEKTVCSNMILFTLFHSNFSNKMDFAAVGGSRRLFTSLIFSMFEGLPISVGAKNTMSLPVQNLGPRTS